MTPTSRDLLPEGLEDRLPRSAEIAARVTRAMVDVLDSHGYDRVQPPLIEFEQSLASRMAGVQTRRMFRFVDPVSLRTLALRNDMTPQVGRIAATRLAGAVRPLRLCYAGQVAQIKGAGGAGGLDPTREHLQIGAELIGNDSVDAAAELVVMAVEALRAAGASRVSVDFTLPDLVDMLAAGALPLAADQMELVRRELDAKDAGGLVAAGGEAYLPLLYAMGDFDAAAATLDMFAAGLSCGGELCDRIAQLKQIAARVGEAARLTLDPTERHGFEYQSWFGFTMYVDGLRGAVGRGGSYRITGKDEPAIGFSLYPDALIDLLSAAEPARNMVFLPFGHDPAAAARLRSDGKRTLAAISAHDDAAQLGCSHVLRDGEILAV